MRDLPIKGKPILLLPATLTAPLNLADRRIARAPGFKNVSDGVPVQPALIVGRRGGRGEGAVEGDGIGNSTHPSVSYGYREFTHRNGRRVIVEVVEVGVREEER